MGNGKKRGSTIVNPRNAMRNKGSSTYAVTEGALEVNFLDQQGRNGNLDVRWPHPDLNR